MVGSAESRDLQHRRCNMLLTLYSAAELLEPTSTPIVSCFTGVVLSEVDAECFRMNDNDLERSNELIPKQGRMQRKEPAGCGDQ